MENKFNWLALPYRFWISPKKVTRSFLDASYSFTFILSSMLIVGILGTVFTYLADANFAFDSISFPDIFKKVLIAIPFYFLGTFIWLGMLKLVSRYIMGSQVKFKELLGVTTCVTGISVAFSGAIFQSLAIFLAGPMLFFLTVTYVIWSFISSTYCLAEAQRLSFFKTFCTLFLTILALLLAIGIPLFGIFYFFLSNLSL